MFNNTFQLYTHTHTFHTQVKGNNNESNNDNQKPGIAANAAEKYKKNELKMNMKHNEMKP